MPVYFASVLPGLEHVLEDEIERKIEDASIQETARGKVFFSSGRSLDRLLCLRTADNLYLLLDHFHVGPHREHLPSLERCIAEIDLAPVVSDKLRHGSFRVNASRAGKHTYSRFEAADAAMRGIAKRYPSWTVGTPEDHSIEFRLDIQHADAMFSLRLTDAAFRYRSDDRRFAQAALRPTVAHAFVWLSNPEPADVFVDPCCGSGTIVAERLTYPARHILGGDISEEAVRAAQENAAAIGTGAEISQWDARSLPLDAGSVDKIVTNLPFGRQILAGEDMSPLYRDVMREIGRVMKTGGTAVCLTETGDLLLEAAGRNNLLCDEQWPLSLKGIHPTLYILRKL